MALCSRLECQEVGCCCGACQWERGAAPGHALPMPMTTVRGCICPGDATPYCQNPMCPRKHPNPDPRIAASDAIRRPKP